MNWSTLAPLIAQVGLPAAFRLWQLISDNSPVTTEKWQELLTLSEKTADDYLQQALVKKTAA